MSQNRKKAHQMGFTLVELIVVLAILALLAGIAGPKVMQVFSGANTKVAQTQVKDFQTALDLYRLDMGHYPTEEKGGLGALLKGSSSRWNGPYIKGSQVPVDPWGFAYHYKNPGEHGKYDVYSLGADNQAGGEKENKDLVSW